MINTFLIIYGPPLQRRVVEADRGAGVYDISLGIGGCDECGRKRQGAAVDSNAACEVVGRGVAIDQGQSTEAGFGQAAGAGNAASDGEHRVGIGIERDAVAEDDRAIVNAGGCISTEQADVRRRP